jgi:hypothetical protein
MIVCPFKYKIIFWNVIPLQKCCHSQIGLLLPPTGGSSVARFHKKRVILLFHKNCGHCNSRFLKLWIALCITCKIHVIKKQDGTSLVLLFPWNKDGTVYSSQQAPSSTFSGVTLPTIGIGRCNAGFLHSWNGSYAIVHEIVSKGQPIFF